MDKRDNVMRASDWAEFALVLLGLAAVFENATAEEISYMFSTRGTLPEHWASEGKKFYKRTGNIVYALSSGVGKEGVEDLFNQARHRFTWRHLLVVNAIESVATKDWVIDEVANHHRDNGSTLWNVGYDEHKGIPSVPLMLTYASHIPQTTLLAGLAAQLNNAGGKSW